MTGFTFAQKPRSLTTSHPVLQRKEINSSQRLSNIPPIVHEVLRSPGQPLDDQSRGYFEPKFGADFSQVRVHTDSDAGRSADAVDALAYTVGRSIVFNTSQYSPRSPAGRQILAHELAHVVQHSGNESRLSELNDISEPSDSLEREANHAAQQVTSGLTDSVGQENASSGTLHRLPFGITLPSGIRGLDPAEVSILTPVFGSSLDYSAIHLSDAVGGGGRPYTVALPMVGLVINIGPSAYTSPGSNPSLLIHESTHCWQSQHHPDPAAYMANSIQSQAAASAVGGDPYCYIPGRAFAAYGAEQIAQQVENGESAIISHVSSVSSGAFDMDNIIGLAAPHWETRGAPGVRC